MFSTDDVARMCAVEPSTVRNWLSKAPGFHIGRRDGRAYEYDATDAAVFVLAASVLKHRNAKPSEAFPVAAHLARANLDTAFIEVSQDGAITASAERPRAGHAFAVLPRSTREWVGRRAAVHPERQRVDRATR